MKIKFILICIVLCICSGDLISQDDEFYLDTIYTKFSKLGDIFRVGETAFFINDTSTVYVDSFGIHPFPSMDYIFQNGSLFAEPGVVAYKDDKYFLVDEKDFTLIPKDGIEIKLDSLNVFYLHEGKVVYTEEGNIYWNDFYNPKKRFIKKFEEKPTRFFNSRFIIISEDSYGDEGTYIYDFKRKKLINIPCDNIYSTENEYFIECKDGFYDLNGKQVVKFVDDYSSTRRVESSQNFLSTDGGKSNVIYFKDKKFTIPFKEMHATYVDGAKLWIITKEPSYRDNYYTLIMDDEGNIIYEQNFKDVKWDLDVIYLRLMNDGGWIIVDDSHKVSHNFSGNYRSIKKLTVNLFVVNSDVVIDSSENIIIPSAKNSRRVQIRFSNAFDKEVISFLDISLNTSEHPAVV